MTTSCFPGTTSESTAIVPSMTNNISWKMYNDRVFLSSSTESEVRMMSLRLKDRPVNSTSGCVQITHPLHNTSQSDTGTYQCVSELTNGTIRRTEAGNLGIVGEWVAFIYARSCL